VDGDTGGPVAHYHRWIQGGKTIQTFAGILIHSQPFEWCHISQILEMPHLLRGRDTHTREMRLYVTRDVRSSLEMWIPHTHARISRERYGIPEGNAMASPKLRICDTAGFVCVWVFQSWIECKNLRLYCNILENVSLHGKWHYDVNFPTNMKLLTSRRIPNKQKIFNKISTKYQTNKKFLTIRRKTNTRKNIVYSKRTLYKYLLYMKGLIGSDVLFA
jgi:hypothetical protein